jgi:hypothetical protein
MKLIIFFLSYFVNQNFTYYPLYSLKYVHSFQVPKEYNKLKELNIKNGEIQAFHLEKETVQYIFTCMSPKKLKGCELYYSNYCGTIEYEGFDKYRAVLTKQNRQLPRSIYPYITSGSLVVYIPKFIFDQYLVINDFKVKESWPMEKY